MRLSQGKEATLRCLVPAYSFEDGGYLQRECGVHAHILKRELVQDDSIQNYGETDHGDLPGGLLLLRVPQN